MNKITNTSKKYYNGSRFQTNNYGEVEVMSKLNKENKV